MAGPVTERSASQPDVSQQMVWIPFITLWQITADMVFAVDVPGGRRPTPDGCPR